MSAADRSTPGYESPARPAPEGVVVRAETNAASAEERPANVTRSVPPWLDPDGMGRLRTRRKASASGITIWTPGASATLVAPAPVAPRDEAGVYVSCTEAEVVPRFASVSSVV